MLKATEPWESGNSVRFPGPLGLPQGATLSSCAVQGRSEGQRKATGPMLEPSSPSPCWAAPSELRAARSATLEKCIVAVFGAEWERGPVAVNCEWDSPVARYLPYGHPLWMQGGVGTSFTSFTPDLMDQITDPAARVQPCQRLAEWLATLPRERIIEHSTLFRTNVRLVVPRDRQWHVAVGRSKEFSAEQEQRVDPIGECRASS